MSTSYSPIGLIYNDFINSKIKGNVYTKVWGRIREDHWSSKSQRAPNIFKYKMTFNKRQK